LDYINMHDRIVASSFKSWHNFKLWNVYEVLWLLGAYLEYLSLVTNRYRASNRDEYIQLMQGHKLAGGGFPLFFEIQEKIDALMDQVNPEDEADVDRIVTEIKQLFEQFPWMSSAFKDLLNGKNHLPDNKLRLNLLNRRVGFMGSGEYRKHFFGEKDYIAQMMFNSPPGLSDAMDLAKMLTVMDMIQPLANGNFRIWKQTRIGLLSHPLDPDAARGHLAAATYLQMALRPHIYHIVGHTEAHHAATAGDVIEASQIARRAIQNAMGAPDMTSDPAIQKRRAELAEEATALLDAIRSLAGPEAGNPFTDASVLARAVTSGILDAPQLLNNKFGRGQARTRIVNGACVSVDSEGKSISESRRIEALFAKGGIS